MQYYRFMLLSVPVLAFGFLLSGSYAAEQKNDSNLTSFQSSSNEYIIGPGDTLEILVWKEPDLSRTYSVRIDGRISVPLLGDIQVGGKTIDGLKEILEKRFKEVVTEPTVSVILTESKSWRYYVIGQVKQSGEFGIDYPITVLQAIAKCGGFSEWAKTDNIKIIKTSKTGKTVIPFDFEGLAKKNDLSQDILLGPGDIILVP